MHVNRQLEGPGSIRSPALLLRYDSRRSKLLLT